MIKAITDFEARTVTIYLETDPFLEDIEEEEEEKSLDDWDLLLDFNLDDVPLLAKKELMPFKDKVELDGNIVKKRKQYKGLKIYGDTKKVNRGITMINHTQAEAMGILINVLFQVGVTTLIAKFLILDIPIDRDAPIVVSRGFLHRIGGIVNTPDRLFLTLDRFCHQTFRAAKSYVMRNSESDSDDEEDYKIKRNKFGAPIYGPKSAPYLNCNDPDGRSLAIQTHEVKRGNKVVKKELIVALRCELYFVKLIINPKEDDVEPGVLLGRSFLRMIKAITDFGARTVTIYLETDPFLEDIEEEKEKSLDDWDLLLDFNLDDVPLLAEKELLPFVCKMRKSSYIPIDRDAPIVVGRGFLHRIGGIVNTPDRLFLTLDRFCHQTFRAAKSYVMRNSESDSDDEEDYKIKRNKF
nr:hypothetical protein [Tanacetum cinerariifolium]